MLELVLQTNAVGIAFTVKKISFKSIVTVLPQ